VTSSKQHNTTTDSDALGIIAGKGAYPLLLAESARLQGVRHIFAVAFKGETRRGITERVDEVAWLRLGQLGALLDAFRASGVRRAVMAGQITPTHLYNVRMDRKMLGLLKTLKQRNAHTIFGAVADELKGAGIELCPAHLYMESAMPKAGVLSARSPTEQEERDIELGLHVAKTTSGLEIGQTVVVKEGTILAVEAFEGTDETIHRAGRLGGAGAVVVKVAKQAHDMRFDIPVVGMRTMKSLKKAKVAVLAVEAGRTILLEKERICAAADKDGLCIIAK